jgi:hypothetical protein
MSIELTDFFVLYALKSGLVEISFNDSVGYIYVMEQRTDLLS